MKSNYRTIEDLVFRVDERNSNSEANVLLGVSIDKCFIPSVANTIGTDLTNYKLIRKDDFAVSLMQISRDSRIPIARQTEYEIAMMSPAYPIFRVKNPNEILPEYLEMWFKRDEFDREAAFIAVGGVRGSMPWNEFAQMQVYVPKMEQQRKIVEAYKIVEDRIKLIQKINDNLEAQAETIYNEMIKNNSTRGIVSSLEYTSSIKTGKLNSEAAVSNGIYPFFTCSQETYRTNTFSFDQEAVLLAGNNASAVYPLKLFQGKFDAYQRTYVITSTNELVSNKQLYFILKQQLNEFKGISSGTATKFLTMKILNPIPVIIAPKKIAESFIEATDKIFNVIYQNQNETEQLTELQGTLLATISSH